MFVIIFSHLLVIDHRPAADFVTYKQPHRRLQQTMVKLVVVEVFVLYVAVQLRLHLKVFNTTTAQSRMLLLQPATSCSTTASCDTPFMFGFVVIVGCIATATATFVVYTSTASHVLFSRCHPSGS